MLNRMPYLYLLAMQAELADAFSLAFADVEDVEIIRNDFAHFMAEHAFVDGIVSPANSYGLMTGGLDKALRDYFGMELQDAVRDIILTEHFGEQTVGTSIAVDIPNHPGKKLIHTPTMRTPSAIIDYQTVYLCMRSALMAAIKSDVRSLMVPAFGGSTGKVPEEIIARNMRSAYDQIKEQMEHPHKETFKTARKRNVIRGSEHPTEITPTSEKAQKRPAGAEPAQQHGCHAPAAQKKKRFIYPRHLDYWREVYGYGGNQDKPCVLEFACHESEVTDPYAVDEFYHFDIVNTAGARILFDELREIEAWNDEIRWADLEEQLALLEAGKIDYFIGSLYFPQAPRFQSFAGQLPAGKSLLDCVNEKGIPSYYAVLHVREDSPLTPDILCAHMEKLSPVLFGDACSYEIPEAAIPDKAEVKKRMAAL